MSLNTVGEKQKAFFQAQRQARIANPMSHTVPLNQAAVVGAMRQARLSGSEPETNADLEKVAERPIGRRARDMINAAQQRRRSEVDRATGIPPEVAGIVGLYNEY